MSEISAVSGVSEIKPYTPAGKLDPYAIFQLNFEAMGGEKNVKYDTTFAYKGEIQLGQYTFDIEEYAKKPLKNLRIVSTNFRVVYKYGDDGVNLWSEQEGDVTKIPDADSPEREIRRLWEEYAYADPKNKTFVATATRKVSIDGDQCYEVKIKNRKTSEVVTHYYDAESYLLKREIREGGYESTRKDFSDYKQVGNTLMAHKIDIVNLQTNSKQIINWTKIDKGVYISDSKFFAPNSGKEPDDFSSITGTGQNINLYA